MCDKLSQTIEEWLHIEDEKREKYNAKYPSDVPNQEGHHAFIQGISVENSFSPVVGELNFFFETATEKIYVWTHTQNKNSALVSEIDIQIKESPFWKTVGSLLTLAQTYYEAFECVDLDTKLEYKIMYYFEQGLSIDKIVFYNMYEIDFAFLFNGRVMKATDIANYSPVIELLYKDDRCYTAVSLLLSSFQIHYCCLICELNLSPVRHHESHEPALWEQPNFITKMECAIVQACRCAECILGEPPNQAKQSRIIAHKQKWTELVGINPDDVFEKAGISYWEFYLKLFDELRNPSAHSYGNIHFDLERKKTIEAQCFAAIIVRGYIQSHESSVECAMNTLNFNTDFLSRVSENISTKMTHIE